MDNYYGQPVSQPYGQGTAQGCMHEPTRAGQPQGYGPYGERNYAADDPEGAEVRRKKGRTSPGAPGSKDTFLTMSAAAEKYGQEYIGWKAWLDTGIFAVFSVAIGLAFNMAWPFLIIMGITGAVFYTGIIKNGYRAKYLATRFSEINTYIEQLCYAFLQEGNVYQSLRDTYDVFPEESDMKKSIRAAIGLIDDADVEADKAIESDGLESIEARYSSDKIKNCHKMLLTAQQNGGDPEGVINVLLKDRLVWEKANDILRKKVDKMKTLVNVSIGVTVILLIVMIRLLMSLGIGVDISRVAALEIAAVAVWVLDLLVAFKSNGTELYDMNGDGRVRGDKGEYDKKILEYYDDYIEYDEAAAWRHALVTAAIPFVVAVFFFIIRKPAIGAVAMVIAAICLLSHKLAHSLQYKELVSEIRVSFPRWLMSINILVQNNNVYNAIKLSYDDAPAILKRELKILIASLDMEPEKKAPFLNFLKDFDLPDITSSMIMLYSAEKDMEHTTDAIAEVLEKNLNIYEAELDSKYDGETGPMYMLFMAPELTSSIKLLMDILFFFKMAMDAVGDI